ncbi:helix-turn-helix domain-containing protein [Sphaerisporangium sp. B11E5]|uniref:helix-turn-helix domain-containing protein n=1 Tax=Sphaerisporangium sp. B11E5 TaxID=3153563 RepID=UPI00325E8948
MNTASELAEAADGQDPRVGLAAVAALRRLLEELEAVHVSAARAQGWSWEEIAAALGVRRQSAHRKHARRVDSGHHDSQRSPQ